MLGRWSEWCRHAADAVGDLCLAASDRAEFGGKGRSGPFPAGDPVMRATYWVAPHEAAASGVRSTQR